jgi:uncharacterized membrane protein
VLYWLGTSLEHALGAAIRLVVTDEHYVPGLGIAVAMVITFLAGLAMRMWITRRLLALAERLLENIPLAKTIYGGARDLMRFVSQASAPGDMNKVVLVELVGGVQAIGFVTSDDVGLAKRIGADEPHVPVYLQMSYQFGGYTVFVPRSRVTALDMELEDAMRWVLTGGVSSGGGNQSG